MCSQKYIVLMGTDDLDQILGPQGSLAGAIPGFEFRPSQLTLAKTVYKALRDKSKAVIEAGTGTGKTLGYLVPIVFSEKKTVISTGTKNLQEQILLKDIPLLSKALGRPIDAVMMKGRKNYLCRYRFDQHFLQPFLLKKEFDGIRGTLHEWSERSEFGDRAELPWLKDDDPLWDSISSTSDQCLGAECMFYEDCFLNRLRQSAAQAQIIVANHHLFFADLMVRKEGFGEIIPRAQAVVFDEAHSLEDIATTYFGKSVSTSQLMDFVGDVEKEIADLPNQEKKKVRRHLEWIKAGAEHLWDLLREGEEKSRLAEESLEGLEKGACLEIRKGLDFIRDKSGFTEEDSPALQSLAGRAHELRQSMDKILGSSDPDWLRWYERRKKTVVLHASPLDISQSMKDLLYEKTGTLVFTSATLSTHGHFQYFRSRMGLTEEVLEGLYPSHFDFESNALFYAPTDLPPPTDPLFTAKVSQRIFEILEITAGRALVLFTSHNNLNAVHRLLQGRIPFSLFKQGEAPKSVLLEKFRTDTHSVLLATGSFWQGVDVPGEALSCLIVDKLPFDSPGDPLVAARIDRIRSQDGNPFMDYQLPAAIIALKQGLGRLIRNSTDRGVLSVLDVRMVKSRYGRFFIESLPGMPLIHDLQAIRRFFEPR
ncbi:MAG: ATP-dependent DNA helicase [Desulfobacterota bacterium]|nr:ATP-dependent DNA helicase [Thermodesulfobacteriota bacterium]